MSNQNNIKSCEDNKNADNINFEESFKKQENNKGKNIQNKKDKEIKDSIEHNNNSKK